MRGARDPLSWLVAIMIVVSGTAVWRGWASPLEGVAARTGALYVWLIAKENVWAFPVGLVNAACYAYMFYAGQLFADGVLNGIYFVLMLFGWYWWLHGGKDRSEARIARMPGRDGAILAVIGLTSAVGLTYYLAVHADAAPSLDAATSVFSLIAQYMTTRKYIENWLVWILVDVVYVPLYIWKGYYLTAVLYAIFTFMAIGGLREWARLRAEQSAASPRAPLWRGVLALTGVGLVAWGWMAWLAIRLEAGLYGAIATIRAATSATFHATYRTSSAMDVPDLAVELDPESLAALKGDLLDPLLTRPKLVKAEPVALPAHPRLVFHGKDMPEATFYFGERGLAWVNVKPSFVFESANILPRLPAEAKLVLEPFGAQPSWSR